MAKRLEKQRKNKKKVIFIIVIVLILFLIIQYSSRKKSSSEIYEYEEKTEEQIQEEENQALISQLRNMTERNRMNFYFGEFLNYIESGNYEEAYNLLYDEFKQNYFPTLESFEEYIPTLFSEVSDIEYTNIERNGEVYVLWINITDAINGKPGEEKEINVVIKENDYNDFELSFSVI